MTFRRFTNRKKKDEDRAEEIESHLPMNGTPNSAKYPLVTWMPTTYDGAEPVSTDRRLCR